MGQAESVPQPAAWQPDFLTAHVKQVSQQLSPVKAPLKGVSSMGADSLSISGATSLQKAIATTDGGTFQPKPYQQRPAGLDQHSFMGVEYMKAKTVVAADRPEPISRPKVGADDFLITRQRKFAQQQNKGFRNQLALAKDVGKEQFFAAKGMDKPGGHQQIDSYDNQFALDSKKFTVGVHGPNGRHQAPEIGKPTNIKGDAYYVEFAKTTHSWMAPKSKTSSEWQGIKPNIPVQDFVKAEKDAKKQNIEENNKIRALPAPQVDSTSYMMKHSKHVNDMNSASPLKFGGRSAEPQPYHSYDVADSPYAMMTPAKAGAKEPMAAPKVGSDSVMMSLAKKAGDMLPKVISGKESKNKPPEEVTL